MLEPSFQSGTLLRAVSPPPLTSRRMQELHLAVPPVHPAIPIGASFSPADWEALSGHVDGLSVMTYDHASNVGSPGPNAPFNWVGANAAAFKLSGDDEKWVAAILSVDFRMLHSSTDRVARLQLHWLQVAH